MEERKARSILGSGHAKSVVHARVGADGCEVLAELSKRKGISQTQALRDLLDDARERMAEEAFGPRLEALARTLVGVMEQQARHAQRIEALVGILRKVEEGQADREAQILQTLSGAVGLCQLTYAHLLGVVETSPRAADISASAQAKMRTLRGEA
jgi:hypothetical protein